VTRFINTLLVALMVLSAAAVYDMKYEAETASLALSDLEQKIAAERAELSLLKAEWSVLTQPARMTDLVDRYQPILQLQPLTANQIGTVADVPEKPVVEPGDEGAEGTRSADADTAVDDDVTGSVDQSDPIAAGDDAGHAE
jgi:hypothetical protein